MEHGVIVAEWLARRPNLLKAALAARCSMRLALSLHAGLHRDRRVQGGVDKASFVMFAISVCPTAHLIELNQSLHEHIVQMGRQEGVRFPLLHAVGGALSLLHSPDKAAIELALHPPLDQMQFQDGGRSPSPKLFAEAAMRDISLLDRGFSAAALFDRSLFDQPPSPAFLEGAVPSSDDIRNWSADWLRAARDAERLECTSPEMLRWIVKHFGPTERDFFAGVEYSAIFTRIRALKTALRARLDDLDTIDGISAWPAETAEKLSSFLDPDAAERDGFPPDDLKFIKRQILLLNQLIDPRRAIAPQPEIQQRLQTLLDLHRWSFDSVRSALVSAVR